MRFSVTRDKSTYRTQFRHSNRRYTHYFGTDSRDVAEQIAIQMRLDWRSGSFDMSLESYTATAIQQRSAEIQQQPRRAKSAITIFDLFNAFIDAQDRVTAKHLEIARMIAKHGSKAPWNDIDWFISLKDTYSASTWNPRRTWLKTAVQWGLNEGLINGFNPYASLKPSKKGRGNNHVKPFSKEEVTAIINALETNKHCSDSSIYPHSHYVLFVKFLFITGVRIGEACGLTSDCIDWTNKKIEIKQSLSRSSASNTRKLKETKTGKTRWINMNEELTVILYEAWSKQSEYKEKYVFNGHRSETINPDNFRKRVWKPVLEGLGIEYRYPYQARHTALSQIATKQGLLAASKIAGHSNPATTGKHYARFVDEVELPSLKDEG